jgi:viroplasmin and RNaseH domain-containing protein
MPKAKKSKYHGVRVGRIPGVYETWPEAEAMVSCPPDEHAIEV